MKSLSRIAPVRGVLGLALGSALLAGLFVAAGSAAAAPAESAAVGSVTGSATLRSGRATSKVSGATKISAGDLLTVAAGGGVTVNLGDGSTVAVSGPAELSFLQLDSSGNRVRLRSGSITRADVQGVALEVQTPADVSLVLQNAAASATVAGSDVTFRKFGGTYAKVWRDGRASDLAATFSTGAAPAAKQPTRRPPAGSPRKAPKAAPKQPAKAAPAPVAFSGNERARASSVAGRVTSRRGGQVTNAQNGTEFRPGDVVRVAADGKLTADMADGSSIALVGPATMQFIQLDPSGRRVMLSSGVISEAYVEGVALEIQSPHDASLVLQNATGFARVAPGDKVTFQKLDGDYARVFAGGNLTEFSGAWTKNVRTGSAGGGTAGTVTGRTAPSGLDIRGLGVAGLGEPRVIQLGRRTIQYRPHKSFKLSPRGASSTTGFLAADSDIQRMVTSSGGLRLTYVGDDAGIVIVGSDTVLYLENGDYVEFDADGRIVKFTGISHIYKPLTGFDFYDEPVENAGDVSISRPGRR